MNRVDSSDYISARKRNIIYSELKQNAKTLQTVNPVKTNGKTYNKNFFILLNKNCNPTSCPGGCLAHVKNYELFNDFNQGKTYNYLRCDPTCQTKCQQCPPVATTCEPCLCFNCAFK
jgi:hypothetical protein